MGASDEVSVPKPRADNFNCCDSLLQIQQESCLKENRELCLLLFLSFLSFLLFFAGGLEHRQHKLYVLVCFGALSARTSKEMGLGIGAF